MDLTRRLAGRRILLTGAGSGIGRAAGRRLAAEGAAVAIIDRRGDAAVAVASGIAAEGGRAFGMSADVTSENDVREAVHVTASEFNGIDGVVACVGILQSGSTHEMSLEEWDTMIRVNLTGTFLPVRECLPYLLDNGGGSIVTIGSIASRVAGGYASSYDASKGGVDQFTRAVAVEYAERNIRANCVCPGWVGTELKVNSVPLLGPLAHEVQPRVRLPMNRRADPSEVAGAIAYLISDDASLTTGATLMVDGGHTAV